jgi:hypothetical protein
VVSRKPVVTTVADRQRTKDLMPGYNNHGDVLEECWPRLTEDQFHLLGDDERILARWRSIPPYRDGPVIDGAIVRGCEERKDAPSALSP